MSATDNFDSLSNAELHSKLLQYGLANVPVTNTSRNVIIKRLRTSISGGVPSPAGKKPNRRETIAAVERASPAKINESAKVGDSATPGRNRRTFAATNTTVSSEQEPIKERRRSVRDSPVPKPTASISKLKKPTALIVLDSDDEDVVAALDKVEQQQQQNNARRSNSRAPSLTKSVVVTTAYNQSLAPLAEESSNAFKQQGQFDNFDHMRDKVDSAFVLHEQQLREQQLREQQLREQQLREQQLREQQLREQQLREQHLREEQHRAQLQREQQQKEQLQREQQLREQQQHAQQRREERVASFNSLYKETAAVPAYTPRYTTPVESSISTASTLSAYSSTASRFNPQPSYPNQSNIYPRLDTIENYSRKTLGASSGYGSRPANYSEFSDETDTDVQKSEEEDQSETPFLSNFARNLNRLKAEQLGGSDLSRRYTRSRTAQEVSGRVSMHRFGQAHNGGDFMHRLAVWNRQYNLTRHIFLVVVLMIVLYTSVQLWQ